MLRYSRSLGVASLVLWWSLIATSTRAQDGHAAPAPQAGLTLNWQVPTGCPSRQHARAEIDQLTRGAGEGNGSARNVRVAVRIQRVASGWSAHVTLEGDEVSGERKFSGASCRSVADAALLIVALAIDPVRVAEHLDQALAVPSPAPHVQGYIGPRFGGDWGSLPRPTLGLGVTGGIAIARFRLELTGQIWLPRVELRGPTVGSGGEIDLISGALRACGSFVRALSFDVAACAALELGVTRGTGVQLARIENAQDFWAAGLIGVAVRQTQAALFVELGLDGGRVIQHPVFVIDGFGPVFESSPWIGRASLTVGWTFP